MQVSQRTIDLEMSRLLFETDREREPLRNIGHSGDVVWFTFTMPGVEISERIHNRSLNELVELGELIELVELPRTSAEAAPEFVLGHIPHTAS